MASASVVLQYIYKLFKNLYAETEKQKEINNHRKNPKQMSDYLPGEVIEQILLRLPVKTLIKFTTVCKPWLSLIKSPTFVQSHLRTTIESNNQNHAHLLLLSAYSFPHEEGIYHEHHWLHWDSPEFGEYTKLPNPLSFFTSKNKPQGLRVIGTFNGLICLQSHYCHIDYDRSPILIWNPSIKKIVKLPRPLGFHDYSNEDYEYRKYAPLGFYYDPHSNDYKVLRIMILRFKSFRLSSDVQLYSLACGSWRRLSTSVAPVDLLARGQRGSPVFVNGCWHMPKKRCQGRDSFIAYFNFATEVFGEIMIPEALRRKKCSISRYHDSLALIKHSDDLINGSSCDIWVMKQYGVAESWTCLFKFNIPVVAGSIHGFKRCGEVVLYERKDPGRSKMISFDPATNQVRVFGSDDYVYDFMDSFVESLVLLDHANAISTK